MTAGGGAGGVFLLHHSTGCVCVGWLPRLETRPRHREVQALQRLCPGHAAPDRTGRACRRRRRAPLHLHGSVRRREDRWHCGRRPRQSPRGMRWTLVLGHPRAEPEAGWRWPDRCVQRWPWCWVSATIACCESGAERGPRWTRCTKRHAWRHCGCRGSRGGTSDGDLGDWLHGGVGEGGCRRGKAFEHDEAGGGRDGPAPARGLHVSGHGN